VQVQQRWRCVSHAGATQSNGGWEVSNVSTEQFEYLLHLMGALVESQTQQAEVMGRIATSLEAIDAQIMDLSYHFRYGGGS
jgi:hypothetical protein